MIEGIGVDLVKIERIAKAAARWQERFLQRVFTSRELDYCYRHRSPYPYLAARFAAKEALAKALGTGLGQGIGWQDIEVLSDGKSPPLLKYKGRVRERLESIRRVHLSISHDGEYAIAQVVLEK